MSCLITMSQKELHRLELIQKIRDERLTASRPPNGSTSVEARSIGCCRPITGMVRPVWSKYGYTSAWRP